MHCAVLCHLQIMILAWPGVVVTFILIAICGRYFFPYGWTWPQALLFGAMLSATDPVAVVAVLHEVSGDCGEGVVVTFIPSSCWLGCVGTISPPMAGPGRRHCCSVLC